MSCIRCQNLERAIEAKQSEYNAALDSACYRVCRKSAAFMRVELEHARAELEEHQFVCPSAFMQPKPLLAATLPRSVRQEEHWGDHSLTAA
jgi:ferredoxin